ncbi:MAG: hypothetical protein JKY95_04840 [Planctomycetaceae bacterium]|nr:hypothetical protein [Planctomycetaceae bacterium]
MTHKIEYSHRERFWLWCLAIFGFSAINIAFIYGVLFQPDAMVSALSNPISLAFIVEAIILMGVFAYLLTKWEVVQLHWGWFVFLSLIGSMAFALPIVLLWSRGTGDSVQPKP